MKEKKTPPKKHQEKLQEKKITRREALKNIAMVSGLIVLQPLISEINFKKTREAKWYCYCSYWSYNSYNIYTEHPEYYSYYSYNSYSKYSRYGSYNSYNKYGSYNSYKNH